MHDKGKLFAIVNPSAQHFESKICPAQITLFSKKKFAACITDSVLQKYGDTNSARSRCTSFGSYFINGNQNPFYVGANYVSINSKLQHAPPPRAAPGNLNFLKFD